MTGHRALPGVGQFAQNNLGEVRRNEITRKRKIKIKRSSVGEVRPRVSTGSRVLDDGGFAVFGYVQIEAAV